MSEQDGALYQYTETLHIAAAEGDVDRITEALKGKTYLL